MVFNLHRLNVEVFYVLGFFLGKTAALDVIRDREVVERFAYEEGYDYLRPMWHTLDPPQLIYPGKSLCTCIKSG